MWSVPREELPGAAMRGAPGARDVLQNTGRTVLYEPRGAISTGKSVTRFTSEGVPIREGLTSGQSNAIRKEHPRDWRAGTAARSAKPCEIPGDGGAGVESPGTFL